MRFLRQRRCLSRLRQALQTRSHTILLFHSVGRPTAAGFLPDALDCAPGFFERVLQLLRAEALVVPLGQVLKHRGAVALTFDDGFQDNFTVALPLLRRYGMPATVFVPVDVVGASTLLPPHRYYFARRHGGEFAEATDTLARRAAVDKFLARVPVPALGTQLYLSRKQVRGLVEAGIEIGAHTRSHPWLAAWPEAEQRREIVDGKQALEEITGRPVTSFAYPYGYRESFNDSAAAIVASQFPIACLSVENPDQADNPLALPRVNLAHWCQR
jgi:peptidoglycan/xylan/chitin deacetylase (PgdA/CDA1 family)